MRAAKHRHRACMVQNTPELFPGAFPLSYICIEHGFWSDRSIPRIHRRNIDRSSQTSTSSINIDVKLNTDRFSCTTSWSISSQSTSSSTSSEPFTLGSSPPLRSLWPTLQLVCRTPRLIRRALLVRIRIYRIELKGRYGHVDRTRGSVC